MKTIALILLVCLLLAGVMVSATMTADTVSAQTMPTATLRTFGSVREAWAAAHRGEITPIHGVSPATWTPVASAIQAEASNAQPATMADVERVVAYIWWSLSRLRY